MSEPKWGRNKENDHVAADTEGNILPLSADEVREVVGQSLNDGEILAVIIKMPNGDLSIPVLGPPDLELADALDTAAKSYRIACMNALGLR